MEKTIALSQYLQHNPKKQLIFDFDETILTLQLPWDIFRIELRKILSQFDRALVNQYPNDSTSILQNKIIAKHGLKAKKAVWAYCQQFETQLLTGIIPNKPIINFIKINYSDLHLYIWSSNMRTTVINALSKYHLQNYFRKIITKNDLNYVKPNPEGFYIIFDAKKNRKKDFLFIGDNENDRLAAQNASIDFFNIKGSPLTKTF